MDVSEQKVVRRVPVPPLEPRARHPVQRAAMTEQIAKLVAAIPDFLAKAVPVVEALVPGARAVSFGHLGDGNLHFNFNSPKSSVNNPRSSSGEIIGKGGFCCWPSW